MSRRRTLLCALLLAAPLAAALGDEDLDPSALLLKARENAAADRQVQAARLGGHALSSERPTVRYNIWSRNCHTEANFFTANATAQGRRAGILACQGDPHNTPEYHTANWIALGGGQMCIYNWGEPCCWRQEGADPSIASGQGLACARAACAEQYHPQETRALPAGELVESPGHLVCTVAAAGGPMQLLPGAAGDAITERLKTGASTVRTRPHPGLPEGAVLTFRPESFAPCESCCLNRAALWADAFDVSPSTTMHAGRQDDFRRRCLSACRASFAGAPPR